MSLRRLSIVFLWAAVCLPFATGASSPSESLWVGRFSDLEPGADLPGGWRAWNLKAERATSYRLSRLDGQTALEAASDRAASALIREISVDPQEFPYLNWVWRIEEPARGGTWTERSSDDFPVRIFVLFEKKPGLFSSLGGALRKLGGGFSGLALNYVWSSGEMSGSSGRSPISDRVAMIAVEGGTGNLGAWVRESRNVVEDYRRQFGGSPGRIVGVALMTDTDDAGGRALSYYGDIHFSKSPANASSGRADKGLETTERPANKDRRR